MCFNLDQNQKLAENILLNHSSKCYLIHTENHDGSTDRSYDVRIPTVELGLWIFTILLTCLLIGTVSLLKVGTFLLSDSVLEDLGHRVILQSNLDSLKLDSKNLSSRKLQSKLPELLVEGVILCREIMRYR